MNVIQNFAKMSVNCPLPFSLFKKIDHFKEDENKIHAVYAMDRMQYKVNF